MCHKTVYSIMHVKIVYSVCSYLVYSNFVLTDDRNVQYKYLLIQQDYVHINKDIVQLLLALICNIYT